MAENSGIQWTNNTFNPWIGCTKVSPACDHCYAEDWDRRYEKVSHWGPKAPRRRTSEKNWNLPLRWNRQAEKEGKRLRVFTASLADIFDNEAPQEWRDDLFSLIGMTPALDWLVLTKRPQNIAKMFRRNWDDFPNIWLGISVENQTEAQRRIPFLIKTPAARKFLSCEPLLGPVDLGPWLFGGDRENPPIDWVITGGESGSHYRSADPNWFRSLRDQCHVRGVKFFFKQWEGASQAIIHKLGRKLDGREWNDIPDAHPKALEAFKAAMEGIPTPEATLL